MFYISIATARFNIYNLFNPNLISYPLSPLPSFPIYPGFLSPDFYTNTGIPPQNNVDYTFDMEVTDGVVRVSIAALTESTAQYHVSIFVFISCKFTHPSFLPSFPPFLSRLLLHYIQI